MVPGPGVPGLSTGSCIDHLIHRYSAVPNHSIRGRVRLGPAKIEPMESRDVAVGGGFRTTARSLNWLDRGCIYYTVGRTRSGSVTADISQPRRRWEVGFKIDGPVEIEHYESVASHRG